MAWSYEPDKLNESPKDQVRFLVGDVSADEPLVQDEEIDFALSQHKNVYMAAAMICDSVAAMFSRLVDSRTGDVEDKFSQRAKAFAERAEQLRTEARSRGLVLAMPFAGGVSVSQKKASENNPDRVKPFFVRNQFGGRF